MSELFNVERVMGFCEKVWYFFIVNLLFIGSNIPVLLFLLFVGVQQIGECLPLFLLSLLPMGPALGAVFYTMNRLIRGTQGRVLRDYKKGYCSDFKQKILLTAGQLLAILVFWTNIRFFSLQIPVLPLEILFVILFSVSVLITPNLYMLIARYEMKNLQIVRTALTLLIARPVATIGNIAALAVVLMAYELAAGTTVLFMGSIYGFLVMFMNQGVLRSLEQESFT